jgi:hypothetical protein
MILLKFDLDIYPLMLTIYRALLLAKFIPITETLISEALFIVMSGKTEGNTIFFFLSSKEVSMRGTSDTSEKVKEAGMKRGVCLRKGWGTFVMCLTRRR